MLAQQVFEIIKQDCVEIYAEDSFREKLLRGKPLKIKLGADPSRPDLHLGHSVVLRKLRLLQDAGHEIIFVIGDFTGMIGDPSGRSKTRVPLTFAETRENGKSYFEQVTKILNPEKTRITYNSEWLSAMTFQDVLELAGKYTLARIMERDDFAKRYGKKQPIGLHELYYPLMQGYDSVALKADVEVGGTDQTFNLLVGRDLQKDYGQPRQDVVTFPLLPGLDGVEKMSKSLDNYIGINEPADVMYEKCMKVPDTLLGDYFRLTTDVPEKTYSPILKADARAAHLLFADTITGMYHSEEAATEAKARYQSVADGKTPDTMDILEVEEAEISLLEALKRAGFASSNADGRRLVAGNGIKLDDMTAGNANIKLSRDTVLKRGKNRFVKIVFVKK